MTKPPSQITLSAEAGEALIVRVHHSGLSGEDAGVVEQVIRMYFWVVFALQEAKLSVKRLRTLLFGKGAPAPPPRVPAAATASAPDGKGGGAGEWRAMEEAASATEPGAS